MSAPCTYCLLHCVIAIALLTFVFNKVELNKFIMLLLEVHFYWVLPTTVFIVSIQ